MSYVKQFLKDIFSLSELHGNLPRPERKEMKIMNDLMTMAILANELSKHQGERNRHRPQPPAARIRLMRAVRSLRQLFHKA